MKQLTMLLQPLAQKVTNIYFHKLFFSMNKRGVITHNTSSVMSFVPQLHHAPAEARIRVRTMNSTMMHHPE
jgi:hypothetical protein